MYVGCVWLRVTWNTANSRENRYWSCHGGFRISRWEFALRASGERKSWSKHSPSDSHKSDKNLNHPLSAHKSHRNYEQRPFAAWWSEQLKPALTMIIPHLHFLFLRNVWVCNVRSNAWFLHSAHVCQTLTPLIHAQHLELVSRRELYRLYKKRSKTFENEGFRQKTFDWLCIKLINV